MDELELDLFVDDLELQLNVPSSEIKHLNSPHTMDHKKNIQTIRITVRERYHVKDLVEQYGLTCLHKVRRMWPALLREYTQLRKFLYNHIYIYVY